MNTQSLLHTADRISMAVGKAFAWLIVLLMLLVVAEVFKRYALNAPTAGIARDKKVEDAAVKAARDFDKNPYPSTYKPYPSAPTALLDTPLARGLVGVAYEDSFAREDREIKRANRAGGPEAARTGRSRPARTSDTSSSIAGEQLPDERLRSQSRSITGSGTWRP